MSNAERTFNHWSTNGKNSHFAVSGQCENNHHSEKRNTQHTRLAFRKGRDDHNEAVQIQIDVAKHYENKTVETMSSLSLDQETWDALVEFVKESRELERKR